MGIVHDFAGGQGGRFFGINPAYVKDPDHVAPGFSPLPRPTLWTWLRAALTLRHIWGTLVVVWAAIALAVYFAFPYDLSVGGISYQSPLSWAFFWSRFPLWLVIVLGYGGFWHVPLYLLTKPWAKRPFLPDRKYSLDKVAHNVFWSTLGIALWVCFENVFTHLWATGRLSYFPDEALLSTPKGLGVLFLSLVLTPLWRDVHFYTSHKFLHYNPVYGGESR
jgi:hypothetical protein